MPYATNKGADQPAHLHSLISAFVVHFLDSMIPTNAIPKQFLLVPGHKIQKTGFLMTVVHIESYTSFECKILMLCYFQCLGTLPV